MARRKSARKRAGKRKAARNAPGGAVPEPSRPSADVGPVMTPSAGAQPPEPAFELSASHGFEGWLDGIGGSLAFTTDRAGKIFFLGRNPEGKLAVFNRTLERCMGLAAAGRSLYVSTLYQIIRFENGMEPGQESADGFDAAYVPQAAYFTGDLDIHDLTVDGFGRLVFVNTLFSCLAAASDRASFVPVWRPPFVSRLATEDRCHLNGMAHRDGALAFATAMAETDVAGGWRENRIDDGVLIDTVSNETVVGGLSMPHSPRLHKGHLYFLNSGTGMFCRADPVAGTLEDIAFCPGYARGLAFAGDYAVIGLSKPRENKTFSGLPLDDALAKYKVAPRCGLIVVDLETGGTVEWVRLDGVVSELYDVIALPGIRNPMMVGFRTDEIRRTVSIGTLDQAIKLPTD